jgi:hypothetical protein
MGAVLQDLREQALRLLTHINTGFVLPVVEGNSITNHWHLENQSAILPYFGGLGHVSVYFNSQKLWGTPPINQYRHPLALLLLLNHA